MKAGITTVGNIVRQSKLIFPTKFLPISLLADRKYHNDMNVGIISMKGLQCTHQHRLSTDGQKLFGNVSTHP